MRIERWATRALLLLAVCLAACSKQDVQATAKQSEMPTTAANAAVITQEMFYDSEALLKAALAMARDLTFLTDLKGQFSGYGSIEALAKRTDAQGNIHWKAFAGMASGTMQGPYGYRTPLGDFVVVAAVTPDQKKIGLVVNLANQKTSLYQVSSGEITPAGDNLASALVVALEVENKVKSNLGYSDHPTAALRERTIAALEQALGDKAGVTTAARPQSDSGTKPNDAADGGAYADAIAAQKAAMTTELSAREVKALGQARAIAMDNRVLQLFYAVFEDAKKSGLQLNDPKSHLDLVNRGRRNSGVWELTVEAYGSDPRFVLTRDFGKASGVFSVESVGAMSAHAYIRDPGFEETGNFSEGCMYEIFQGNRSVKYGCMAFLEGKHDKEAFAALRDMVIVEVKGASSRRTQ